MTYICDVINDNNNNDDKDQDEASVQLLYADDDEDGDEDDNSDEDTIIAGCSLACGTIFLAVLIIIFGVISLLAGSGFLYLGFADWNDGNFLLLLLFFSFSSPFLLLLFLLPSPFSFSCRYDQAAGGHLRLPRAR